MVILMYKGVVLALLAVSILAAIGHIPVITFSHNTIVPSQTLVLVVNQTPCMIPGANAYFENLSSALDYLNNTVSYGGYDEAYIYICPGHYNDSFPIDYYVLHDLYITAYNSSDPPYVNITSHYGPGFIYSENIVFSGLIINGSLTSGSQLEFGYSSDIGIYSVELHNSYTGIIIFDTEGIRLRSIDIHQTHEMGIYIEDSRDTVILSTYIEGPGPGGGIPEGVRSKTPFVSRHGGIVMPRRGADEGIGIRQADTYGVYLDNTSDIMVSDMILINYTYGLYADECDNITLERLDLHNNTFGVLIEYSNDTISRGITSGGNLYAQVFFDSINVTIENPYMSGDYLGIYTDNTMNIVMRNVTCLYQVYSIALLNSSNALLRDLKLMDVYYVGLYVYGETYYGKTMNITVLNAIISGAPGASYGVYMYTGNWVRDVLLRYILVEDVDTGVYMDGRNITLMDSNVRNCGIGIEITGGWDHEGSLIKKVHVYNNSVGIYISEAIGAEISDAHVEDNEYGIYMYYHTSSLSYYGAHVNNSLIEDNSHNGVYIDIDINSASETPVILFKNTTLRDTMGTPLSDDGGIYITGYVDSASETDKIIVFEGCLVVNNTPLGAYIDEASNVWFISSRITDNDNGIYVDSSENIYIVSSYVAGNREFDISSTDSHNVSIDRTIFSYKYNCRLNLTIHGFVYVHILPHDQLMDLYEYVPGGARSLTAAFNITIESSGSWAYVVYEYTDELLEEKGVGEDYIGYYYYDPVEHTWKPAPTIQDKDANTLSINITSGTVYSVLGFPPPGVGGEIIGSSIGATADYLLLVLVSLIAVIVCLQLIIRAKTR